MRPATPAALALDVTLTRAALLAAREAQAQAHAACLTALTVVHARPDGLTRPQAYNAADAARTLAEITVEALEDRLGRLVAQAETGSAAARIMRALARDARRLDVMA